MVIQRAELQLGLLAGSLCYPCPVCAHRFSTLCIVSVFPHPWAINRGDLRSAGISRFFAKPLRFHRSPSPVSASSDWPLVTLVCRTWLLSHRSRMLRQNLGLADTRLVTPTPLSNSMLSETPGGRNGACLLAPFVLPAP